MLNIFYCWNISTNTSSTKSYGVTIQIKPLQQYFYMVSLVFRYFTKQILGFFFIKTTKTKPQSHLDISKVYSVQVSQHLRDLRGILQYGTCSLGQVVQWGVATECLCKCTACWHLLNQCDICKPSEHVIIEILLLMLSKIVVITKLWKKRLGLWQVWRNTGRVTVIAVHHPCQNVL